MKPLFFSCLFCLSLPWLVVGVPTASAAAIEVQIEHSRRNQGFAWSNLPKPAANDAASQASWRLVDGQRDRNGAGLEALHDGRLPSNEDDPSANFFFQAGTAGGRLQVDLSKPISVKRVGTYSWHSGSRGPQVYTLYAADGQKAGFTPAPERGTDPLACGWQRLAEVDTRPDADERDSMGGQYGVNIKNEGGGVLGSFRYLLFDVRPTETESSFGLTFYSEIDVEDADGPELKPIEQEEPREPIIIGFSAGEDQYRFTIDATAAPDLADWARENLIPVVQEWYPKLVAMLPSEDFTPADDVTLRFRDDMGGTPASAGGGRINMNSGWFRRELDREARGSVVHEMVHIIQNYRRARRSDPDVTRTPGWLVEGLADYIRWFLYEPETRGAEITERNFDRARYDASYRITGNFLDWVVRTHDKEIVRVLNAAAREGRYREAIWQERTGRSLMQLGEDWRSYHAKRLEIETDKETSEESP